MQYPVQISNFEVMKENELSSEAVEKKLYKLLCECEDMCREAGLQIGYVKEIYINKRLNFAWGRCVIMIKEGYSNIEINQKLLSEHVPESSLRNTILHELCHTVPNGSGHKRGWRAAANKIKDVYDIQLSVTNSAKSLGVIPELCSADKYIFRCSGCGQVVSYSRRTKFVKNTSDYRCGICKGKFEMIKGE